MMDYNTSKHKMLHETQNDFVAAIRKYTRNRTAVPESQFIQINELADEELEDFYIQFSEQHTFMAMVMPEQTKIKWFVEWATTSPIQQYKLAKKGVK